MAMTTDKLRSAFLACEAIIARQEGGISMAIRDENADSRIRRLSHLLWLSREGLTLIEDNRREKAMRWLGFLQGSLWGMELATIDQLKEMNRPEDSEHDPERV